MKHLLRIVILGPLVAVVETTILILMPLVLFIDWLARNQHPRDVWRRYMSEFREDWHFVWTGVRP